MADTNKIEEHQLSFQDEDEKLRVHRICEYMRDLRSRLTNMCEQHSTIIQSSVNIIKEVSEVSSMLETAQMGANLHSMTKIKRLILEFESAQTCNIYDSKSADLDLSDVTDLRQMMKVFETLNESNLLRDGVMLFKRAKESFEQIQESLDKFKNTSNGNAKSVAPQASPQMSKELVDSSNGNRSLRDRIQLFNKVAQEGNNPAVHFASCFSSNTSMVDAFHSATEMKPALGSSLTNSGYEGDVDSELDQPITTPFKS